MTLGPAVDRRRQRRVAVVAAGLLASGLGMVAPGAPASHASSPYIVVLEPGAGDPGMVAAEHARRFDAQVGHVYRSALSGYSARLDPARLAALRRDPRVESVSPGGGKVAAAAQTVPFGVDRVEADLSSTAAIDDVATPALDIDVAVLDTGIDQTHPDLTVVGGYNCAADGRADYRDLVGHGTHIAGTIGAKDDGVGVVGVAPGVRLWAVRVLDRAGVGEVEELICGIDWVTSTRTDADPTNDIEVANLSLGTPGHDDRTCGERDDDALHRAVCASVEAGVVYVTAAGNAIPRSGDPGGPRPEDARRWVPASYDEVITVSAIVDSDGRPGSDGGAPKCRPGDDDTFATFSNYGRDVDLAAPGVCIYSTLPVDGVRSQSEGYGYYSGTSFAAPHVSGAAALYLAQHHTATPAEVRDALLKAGSYDWDAETDPDHDQEPLVDVSGF